MTADGWRFGPLIREASKNVFTPGSRLAAVLIIGGLVGVAQTGAGALESAVLSSELTGLALDGRNVVVFHGNDSAEETHILTRSCEGLADSPGVVRAGSLVGGSRVDVIPLGSRISTMRASSTLIHELSAADAVVGTALVTPEVTTLTIETSQGILASAIRGSEQPAGLTLNSSVIFPLTVDDAWTDSCVVVFEPHADVQSASAVASSQLIADGTSIESTVLVSGGQDPITTFLSRLTQFLPVVLGLVAGAMLAIVSRSRSGEFASYRLSGTTTRSLLTLMTLENMLLSSWTAAAATVCALVTSAYFPDVTVPVLRAALLGAVMMATAIPAGVWFATRNPLDLSRDR